MGAIWAISLTTSPGMWPVHLESASKFTGLMTWSVDRSILGREDSLVRLGDTPCSVVMGQQEGWADLAPGQLCPTSCASAARALCLMEATHTRKHSCVLAMQTQLPSLCACICVHMCMSIHLCSTCGSQMLMSSITSPLTLMCWLGWQSTSRTCLLSLLTPESLAIMCGLYVGAGEAEPACFHSKHFIPTGPLIIFQFTYSFLLCVHVHDAYMYAWRSEDGLVESLPFLPLSRFCACTAGPFTY